jgi:hypothetical protein
MRWSRLKNQDPATLFAIVVEHAVAGRSDPSVHRHRVAQPQKPR